MKRDAGAAREDTRDILFDHLPRQAECGDAPGHHAAGLGFRLVHVDPIARGGKVLRGGQPGRPGPYDRDALVLRGASLRQAVSWSQPVHDIALERTNRDGAIGTGAAASWFAGRVANPAANARKRVGGCDGFERAAKVALPDKAHIGTYIGAYGASRLAGRRLIMRQPALVGSQVECEGLALAHSQATLLESSFWRAL